MVDTAIEKAGAFESVATYTSAGTVNNITIPIQLCQVQGPMTFWFKPFGIEVCATSL